MRRFGAVGQSNYSPKKTNLRHDLGAHATVTVVAQGILESLALLGSYLPSTLIQTAQARKIAAATLGAQSQGGENNLDKFDLNSSEDIQAFLEANHLRIPIYSQLRGVGAMLLPALVSPFISAILSLTGGL